MGSWEPMAGGETRDLEDKFQDLSRPSRLNAKEKNIRYIYIYSPFALQKLQ